jgi:DMSO/TMAO reductase YedYZ molybdopterin-dependent catalytic subunit
MTRRELLVLPGACPLLQQALASSPREPQNLSYPLQAIEGAVTPPEMFFVRDHFNEPELSLSAWRLKIDGRVAHSVELSLADLLESPVKKLEAVLECAGNAAGGSAASNGIWEGVPFGYLLRQAGIEPGASTVLLEGADSGRLMQDSPSLPYYQMVPLAKCMQQDSLVALKLNDRFLPRRNGFPARALFPGWYAMDSVKWLRRITVLRPEDPDPGFETSGMNKVYNRIVETAPGDRAITRLTGIQVKSAIAWPPDNWKLPAGQHVIRGFAWTGSGMVRSVEFSSDGGGAWTPAKLEAGAKPYRWIRWNYSWRASPGEHVLMSRASDDSGNSQPLKRQPGRKDGYELNFCAPVRCSVQ